MNPRHRPKQSPLGLSTLLLLLQSAAAIPYTPTSLFLAPQYNDTLAYLLQPSSTGKTEFLSLNISTSVDASNPAFHTLLPETPFQSSEEASTLIPVIDDHGAISVYTGNCHHASNQHTLWRFHSENTSSTGNGSWSQLSVSLEEETARPYLLSAGFTFASSNKTESPVYTFGGMCPFANATDQTWVSAANYSQSMVVLDPSATDTSRYLATTTGHRAPPVPEAGMAIVPLPATSSLASTEKQQDFLFIGGHTRQAFLNMSQLAIFSVPQESWSFVNVNSQARTKTELARSQTLIEPRSGHTAVLSGDGKTVLGRDTSTPADPQFVVLEVGEEYGGVSDWAWSIPSSSSNAGIAEGTGLFGHSAVMLSGDVLMVAGGYIIPKQTSKRSTTSSQRNSQVYLFNTTSSSWVKSYTNPLALPSSNLMHKSHGSGLTTGQKTGLGVGLGLGLPLLIAIGIYAWKRDKKRRLKGQRDSQLRELALGAERAHFWGRDDPFQASSIRSSQINEKQPLDPAYPWSGNHSTTTRGSWSEQGEGAAERSGLLGDTSPTKNSRPFAQQRPQRQSGLTEFRRSDTTSDIHPIDEREEDEAIFRERLMATIPPGDKTVVEAEDPFADLETPFATPRSTIFGVGLGPFYSRRKDFGDPGRVSPTKSDDRTSSNLSDASSISFSSDSKPLSQVTKARGVVIDRPLSWASSGGQSFDQLDPGHSRETTHSDIDGVAAPSEKSFSTDSYSTAHTTFSQHRAENESLLYDTDLVTPGESSTPSKLPPYSKPRPSEGIFSSVRRALTLTRRPTSNEAEFEAAPLASGIDRRSTVMIPGAFPNASGVSTPRRAVSASAELFRRKQGAKDWIAKKRMSDGVFQTPKSTRDDLFLNAPGWLGDDDTCDETWDEDHRVQTTYAAPRERLRVVNATDMDNVSERSLSRSLSNAPSTRRVSN
ncbi:uncharacterized protein N7477_005680 [Penicillium maclennaniae]|uniref:uncharacterized protein n=1 Tax=Penicillium maclennaniae TaxID=1343394 RepID=UPI002542239A|nr:uncharacterized protein N7477_005680 [Penicillium maclennaniae]KAJ5670317.1 hypothetical protein N7477_005680 [Penicillium maclennaniae]